MPVFKKREPNIISIRRSTNTMNVCLLAAIFLALSFVVVVVQGHGYLYEPAGRSTLWRYNSAAQQVYPGAVTNSNDMGLNCGGTGIQFDTVNKGRCGECGDAWSISRPRPHDEGGLYGKNIIAKTYTSGKVVQFKVVITMSHQGYMEFRLCPKNSASELATQECFDKNLLETFWGWTKVNVDRGTTTYYPLIRLPAGVTCNHCVVQWTYVAASNWGDCRNGTTGCGCGNQETYRNCADITILPA